MTGAALSSLQVNDALPAVLPVPLFALPGMTLADPLSLPAIALAAEHAAKIEKRTGFAPIWRSLVVHGLLISVIWGLSTHPGRVLHQASSSGMVGGPLIRASLIGGGPTSPPPHALPLSQPVSAIKPVANPKSQSVADVAPAVASQSATVLQKASSSPQATSATQPVVLHHQPHAQRKSKVVAAAVHRVPALARAANPVAVSPPSVRPPTMAARPTSEPLTQASTTQAQTVASPLALATSAAAATPPSRGTPSATASSSASAEPAGGPVITQARYLGSPPQLEYPAMARRLGQQGRVVVEVWLDATGQVLQSHILSSPGIPALEQAALRYVAASRFAPFTRDGLGHAARLHLSVDFRLR